MLKPWKKIIITNNLLILLNTIISVIPLVAILPILQLIYLQSSDTQLKIENRNPVHLANNEESDPNIFDDIISEFEIKKENFLNDIRELAIVDPQKTLFILALVMIGAAFLKLLLSSSSSICIAYIQTKFLHQLMRDLYYHSINHDLVFHNRYPPGKLLTRLMVDINKVQWLIELIYGARIKYPIMIIVLVTIIFLLNFKLALLSILVMPIVVLPSILISKKIREISKKETNIDASLADVLEEQFNGISLIKTYSAQKSQAAIFEAESTKSFHRRYVRTIFMYLGKPIQDLVITCVIIGFLFAGFKLVLDYTWVEGDIFLMFIVLISSLYRPIKNLLALNFSMQRPLMSAVAIFKILDNKPKIEDSKDSINFPKHWETIKFENVNFNYRINGNKEFVLNNLSIQVPRNKFTLLFGHNGSGKSTVTKLLTRQYEYKEGRILVGNHELKKIKVGDINREIGIVQQDQILFNLSIAENIAFGLLEEEIDHQLVEHAARKVGADKFINNLPNGYDTLVGRRGGKLSGGEKQMISLARCIYFDFNIIILDEPSLNLDKQAFNHLLEFLQSLKGKKTVVLVTHDSKLMNIADNFYHIVDGKATLFRPEIDVVGENKIAN